MTKYEPGQSVLIVDGYRKGEPRAGTVTKVARKYVTVAPDSYPTFTTEYDMATGYARGEFGNRSRIYTPEGYAEVQEKRALTERLHRHHGVTFAFGPGPTLAQLRAIADVMGEES